MIGHQIKELEHTVLPEVLAQHQEVPKIYADVLTQDKDKKGGEIYNLHNPFTTYIAKGKADMVYEFGIMLVLNRRLSDTSKNSSEWHRIIMRAKTPS